MPYDENSIKILSAREINERCDWVKAETLAAEYNLPLEWVNRGFEACHRLGISPGLFVDKYINGLDVEMPKVFEEVFKEVVREERERLQGQRKTHDKTT
ncbi:TPA: hypothetical protein KNG82_002197 [Escherichia coli]|nr:hypothetical protein [Escherichia coli]